MDLTEDVRRALGFAMQLLEELPCELRPHSNIEDMRTLLAGQSTGRDGVIIAEATATALAYHTLRTITKPPHVVGPPDENSNRSLEIYTTRARQFAELFELVRHVDVTTFAQCYLQACVRIGYRE